MLSSELLFWRKLPIEKSCMCNSCMSGRNRFLLGCLSPRCHAFPHVAGTGKVEWIHHLSPSLSNADGLMFDLVCAQAKRVPISPSSVT